MAYYGLNLLFDLLISRKPPKAYSPGDVLFFDEDVRPEIIVPAEAPIPEPAETATALQPGTPQAPQATETADEPPPQLSGPIRSTGAVGLKELFNLAKDNLIEYTGEIFYA
ncbi:hypothetical protein CHT99_01225 [Sphingobacterium cellulitidis]|nr:hypothetical protein CHT99_01225 [Sphingobacterium cellulitidis]